MAADDEPVADECVAPGDEAAAVVLVDDNGWVVQVAVLGTFCDEGDLGSAVLAIFWCSWMIGSKSFSSTCTASAWSLGRAIARAIIPLRYSSFQFCGELFPSRQACCCWVSYACLASENY